jgi:hypothetical protein
MIRDTVVHTVDAAVPVPDTGALRTDLMEMLDGVRALLASPFGARTTAR